MQRAAHTSASRGLPRLSAVEVGVEKIFTRRIDQ